MAFTPYSTPGLLPADNPISQWVAPRRNALLGFGAGMLSPGLSGAATGAMQGMAMDRDYAMAADEQAKAEQSTNATKAWLEQAYPQYSMLPPDQGFQLAMKAEAEKMGGPSSGLMSVGGHLYDPASGGWISPPQTADNRQNISLTPQWGRDEQGNPVMLQPSSTGELVRAQTPEGVTLMGPFDTSADRAAGGAFGKGIGGAQLDLPGAQLIAEQTIGAINDVRSETAGMAEHFGNVMGVPQQMTPAWPGSEKAKFQVAADRAINRAFLQGREMLKGGGQITDFESRKAEAAITAAQSALEKGDQAQFLKALDDFEQAVRDGVAKMQGQSQTMPGYGAARQPQGGPTPNGRTMTYNPATGRLE